MQSNRQQIKSNIYIMGEKSLVLMFCLLLLILVSLSRQAVTALTPVGFGYAFCVTTCIANRNSLGDCIQRCLLSEELVETLEETHLTSSSVFCTVGCAAMTC
ncbi:hypothetical protein V6Z12_D01G113100 [Gossypium hirsutum]